MDELIVCSTIAYLMYRYEFLFPIERILTFFYEKQIKTKFLLSI